MNEKNLNDLYSTDISINEAIRGNYIKYTTLGPLIETSYIGSSADHINIFIDLASVLTRVYSGRYDNIDRTNYDIVSAILNMSAHYKRYFSRYLGVSSTIYLIYGLNCPLINSSIIKGYNSASIRHITVRKDLTEYIYNNLAILSMITQYIPNLYFFDCKNAEVSSMIDYIISSTNCKNEENVIVSKDTLALSLVPRYNCRILVPMKKYDKDNNTSSDASLIVDNNNLWKQYAINYRKINIPEENISTSFISNILAMTAVKERGLKSRIGNPVAFRLIRNAIDIGFLENSGRFYLQSEVNNAIDNFRPSNYNPSEIEVRYKAIDSHYQATYTLLLENPEFKHLRFTDMRDDIELQNICNRYFKEQINLEDLF